MRFILGFLAAMCICSIARAKPVTIAVVAQPGAGAEQAAALLTQALAAGRTYQLVERQALAKVLKEQTLSRAGLTPEQSVRVGRLVGADGLLLLSMDGKGKDARLTARLMAVQPGVVVWLVHQPAPRKARKDGSEAEEITSGVAQLAARVDAAADKLRVSRERAVPVSVLNLRSLLPNQKTMDQAAALRVRLIYRLVQAPRLFVLERSHLDRLFAEKAWAAGFEQPFWSGAYVVDGELMTAAGPDGKKLQVTLHVRPAKGPAKTIKVSGSADDPPALADQLAAKLEEALVGKAAKAKAWDPKAEAQRLEQEAIWAEAAHAKPSVIYAAAESAWILGGRSQTLAKLRLRCRLRRLYPDESSFEWAQSQWTDAIHTPFEKKLKTAANPLSLQRRWIAQAMEVLRMYDRLANEKWDHPYRPGFKVVAAASSVLWACQDCEQMIELAAPLQQLRQRTRQTVQWIKDSANARRKAGQLGKDDWPEQDIYWLAAEMIGYWHDTPEQALKAYHQLVNDPLPCQCKVSFQSQLIRHLVLRWRGAAFLVYWTGKPDPQHIKDLSQQFVKYMVDGKDSRFQLLGAGMAHTFADTKEARHKAAVALRDLLWAYREQFVDNRLSGVYFRSMWGTVGRDLGAKPGSSYREAQAFQLKMLNYLLDHGKWIQDLRDLLVYDLDDAQARILLPKLRIYLKQYDKWNHKGEWGNDNDAVHRFIRRLVKKYPTLRNAPPPNLLIIHRRWLPPKGLSKSRIECRAMLWDNHHLWILGCSDHDHRRQAWLFKISLPDGRVQVIPAPTVTGHTYNVSFTISVNTIYYSMWPHVFAYNRETHAWRGIKGLKGASEAPVAIGQSLYAVVVDHDKTGRTLRPAMVRTDLDGGHLRIIASAQRTPPQSPLDNPNVTMWGLECPIGGHRLYVHYRISGGDDHMTVYDPATGHWDHANFLDYAKWKFRGDVVESVNSRLRDTHDPDDVYRRLAVDVPGSLQPAVIPFRVGTPEWPNANGKLVPVQNRQQISGSPSLFSIPPGLLMQYDYPRRGFWFVPKAELNAAARKTLAHMPPVPNGLKLWKQRYLTQPPDQRGWVLAVLSTVNRHKHVYLVRGDNSWYGQLAIKANGSISASSTGARLLVPQRWEHGYAIVAKDLLTGGVRTLAGSRRRMVRPQYNADGTRIAYVCKDDNQYNDVFVMDLKTRQVRQITDDDQWKWRPAWSPDGNYIIYSGKHYHPTNPKKLWILWRVNLRTGKRMALLSGSHNYYGAHYSPDGKHILYTFSKVGDDKHRGIYMMNADGTGSKLLTRGFHEECSVWSPDGKAIAYMAEDNLKEDHIAHIMDLKTGKVTVLDCLPGNQWSVVFLPSLGEDQPRMNAEEHRPNE